MHLLAPVMTLFNLPPEAAFAVVLGSVRKDGLAIGLLSGCAANAVLGATLPNKAD